MKTVQVRKNVFLFLGALSFLTVLLSGCLKSTQTSSTPPRTFLSLMHLAPRAPAVEVYFNNNSKPASSPINPGTVASTYSGLDPAMYSITFKKAGSDSLMASIPTNLYDTSRYYTLLVYNSDSTHVNAVRIVDDFSVMTNMQKAYYRFFHMSPDIGPVDIYFDNTLIESGREYADNTLSTSFNTFLPANPNTYNVVVKKAGTDTVVTQTYSVFMGASYAYTLFLKGIPGQTGNTALKLDYVQAAD
jgi:hypothetical protein